MKNKIILSMTLLFLSLSLFAFSSGTGTENDPFMISTAEHFNAIRNYMGAAHSSKHFKLETDISLGTYSAGSGWQPIGTDRYNAFCGKLDGNGKQITGLEINRETENNIALFAFTNGAVIKNLAVTGVMITGKDYTSALVAQSLNNSLTEGCKSTGNVTGQKFVAGLVAFNQNSTIRDSYSRCRVIGANTTGGLFAVNEATPAPDMVFVEGGTFSPDGGNYNVTLSPFYMAKYEVTQAEWASVMTGNNNNIPTTPSYFSGTNNPVEQVSWYDIMVYCNRRSIAENLTPVYAKGGETNPNNWGNAPEWTTDADWDAITMNMSANGYRLPTEMEWEWAARGGVPAQQAGTFNTTYAGSNDINEVAWYSSNSGSSTHPVGTKAPNELGLYDMSGNVWEWCWDWFEDWSYPSGSFIDPVGPNSGSVRMLRGVSCYDYALSCTVSGRYFYYPDNCNVSLGFRPLRAILD